MKNIFVVTILLAVFVSSCAKDSTTNKLTNSKDADKQKTSSGPKSGSKDCSKVECDADQGSEVLSGMNLAGLTFENGTMHCKSTKIDNGKFRSDCDAYAKQSDGSEKKAETISDGTEIEWVFPIVNGIAVINAEGCGPSKDKLSYSCTDVQVTTSAALEHSIVFKKVISRTEVDTVVMANSGGPQ